LWAATIFLALPEGAAHLSGSPEGGAVETSVRHGVLWLRLLVETIGAAVICLGIVVAAVQFVRTLVSGQHLDNYNRTRLTLARYLALALEFQLGATSSRPPSPPPGIRSANSEPSPSSAPPSTIFSCAR
jgi:hypothetical protein